jgi:hypothetical protein
LQYRLDCPKVGADIFDSARDIFDIVDSLGVELGALESCSERVQGNNKNKKNNEIYAHE